MRPGFACANVSVPSGTLGAYESSPCVPHLAPLGQVAPTTWPLFGDVIALLPGGLLKPGSGAVINASGALLAACELPAAASVANCSSLAEAVDNPAAIVAAVTALMGAGPAADPVASATGFTMTLTGATWVALRSLPTALPPGAAAGAATGFSLQTNVSVGGITCIVGAVSPDASWLIFRTPPAAALCASPGVDCGYVRLEVANPPLPGLPGAIPAAVACPPFCPGAFVGAQPLLTSASSRGAAAFIPAWPSLSEGAVPAAVDAATIMAGAASGLYYAAACRCEKRKINAKG